MRRKKAISQPLWLIWEGDDFPRALSSDSIIFYINEHIYLEDDELARKALAKQLQLEGLTYSLSESYKAIEDGNVIRAGYYYKENDEFLQIYCENNDIDLEYDATFVEVPYVL